MTFIIGGAFQGKTEFALTLTNLNKNDIANGATASNDIINNKPILNSLHLLIKRLLDDNKSTDFIKDYINTIISSNKDIIIITNEIGYGIVPIDKKERIYRELTGHICQAIASKSDTVYRVFAGIGTIIKES